VCDIEDYNDGENFNHMNTFYFKYLNKKKLFR